MIGGEIGSRPFGYSAVGEQAGMAQRIESVVPPYADVQRVKSATVDGAADLGAAELVQIKGVQS